MFGLSARTDGSDGQKAKQIFQHCVLHSIDACRPEGRHAWVESVFDDAEQPAAESAKIASKMDVPGTDGIRRATGRRRTLRESVWAGSPHDLLHRRWNQGAAIVGILPAPITPFRGD